MLVTAACGGVAADAPSDAADAATTPLETTTTTSAPTTTTTTITPAEVSASATITGDPLPRFGTAPDPAVGLAAPVVTGTGFDGSEIRIEPAGAFTVVMFLAHWCPHCQDEVEQLGPYFAESPPPDGIEVVVVSTGVDEQRPNYPPSEWLTPEVWDFPVMADTADSAVGAAFGLNAFPFWVVLDPDGVVLARTAGSLPLETVDGLFASLASLQG